MTTILITDDYYQNIELLSDILISIDDTLDIKHADSGEEALDMIETEINESGESFDLIFMDFQMPGMNGALTTTKIRELESDANCKSIIVTWSSAKEAPYPDADDWLPKPPRKEDVEYLLEIYCN